MLSFLLYTLVVILGFCILLKARYWSIITVIALFLIVSMISFGGLPALLLKNLQIFPYKQNILVFKEKNAIVLLGGGVADVSKDVLLPSSFTYSRIIAAAQTYFACKQAHKTCTIITSGGDFRASPKREAHVYKAELLNLGIDSADIKSESKSRNTYENAKFSSKLIKAQHYNQVFLVTSGIHMQRAELSFAHFGIAAIPIASDYMQAKSSLLALGYNLNMSDAALHEWLGVLKYKLMDFSDN